MAERGTFETLLAEVGQALLPLREALASPEAFVGFLTKLGWRAEDIPQPLRQVGESTEVLYDLLRKILGDGGLNVGGAVSGYTDDGAALAIDVSLDDIQRGIQAVTDVIEGIRAIETAPAGAIPAQLLADGFATEFPTQLLDHLVITYLTRFHPRIGFGLKALGVVKSGYAASAGNRPAYVHQTLDLSDLPQLLDDPSIVLKNAFGWGEPTFDAGALLREVDNLLTSLGLSVHIESQRTGAVRVLTGAEPALGATPISGLAAIIFERVRASGRMAAELRLVGLPASGPALPGLALFPTFNGALDFTWQLDEDISLTVRSDLNVAGGLGLKVRPGTSIELVVGFEDGDAPVGASGSVDIKVARGITDGPPQIILGSPGETRLQYRTIAGVGGIRLANGADLDVFLELDLKGLEFVIDAGEADGFIAKLLPEDGITFGSDLAVGISHRQGFYFRGTSNLELSVPAHVQIGPVEIQSLLISAIPADGKLPIKLGATFKAALGPVQAVVEGIGLEATLAFPANRDGNLGPINLDLDFLPPRGVGLSVDAGVVKGGGYLVVDAARGEYAGALELTFANLVSIKAIGIITTKAPDGSPGFSLLIIMSVEFGTGIQLGFGFTLLALGGLVGLNRTMNLQALTDGVRSGSLTSVMFPRDIVANAPKIISDLRTFFPAHDGTFLIGPMIKLGWGTPTLVSLSVGVVIEIPGNIAILGVLKVALPAEEAPVIQLKVQFVGAIELDKKRLWFFASLYDSRVVFITLDGEMGLLVAWGDDANFVVSVGGFHPRFSPPPLPFPSPRRLSIPLLNNPLSKLTVEGYFAVTSNTAQFGARVEAQFGLSDLNVSGQLAFDALFQFAPFHFVIEISASLSVRVFGVGLFSVGIGGTLEGPTPWHVLGHGSISLLFWDIDVDFETTWGDSRTDQLEPVKVMELVTEELGKPGAWKAVLLDASKLMVTLRELPGETAELILHPTGLLRVSQLAVPFDLKLDKVGNRAPSDVNRVTVSPPATGLTRSDDAYELFAPAQYRNFSDAEKLSQPAFGREKSGLILTAGDQDSKTSGMVKRVVRYEEIIIDNEFKRHQSSYVSILPNLFLFFMNANAAAKMSISAGAKKLLDAFEDKVVVSEQTYAVALQATNQAFSAETTTFQSAASAHGFVAQLLADDPTLVDTVHIIPTVEVFSG